VEFRTLRYFEVVARHQHLGAAAAELDIYESSLSRSIARLEKEYGPLFDRVGRGLRINAYGRLLLVHVQRALADLDDAGAQIAEMRKGEGAQIALGFVPSLGAFVVPDLVTRFKRIHPEAQFRFVQDGRIPLRASLLRGDVDLVMASHRYDDPSIDWEPLWDEELVAVVPPGHPLARRRLVSLSELAREPMLAFKAPHTMRLAVDELARRENFVPNIVFEADDAQTLLGLVGTGLGIALLPESIEAVRGRAKVLHLRASRWRVVGLSWVNGRYERRITALFRRFVAATARKDAARRRNNAAF
jgi:LysR family transcriptional activator of glutamate synthase operon